MARKNFEREIIEYLSKNLSRRSPFICQGIGDDAACLTGFEDLVVAKDILYEDVHFRIEDSNSFSLAAEKAFLVNISDLLAKGVLSPYFFMLGLGIPGKYSLQEVKKIFSGIKKVLKQYNSFLVGGDVIRCDKLCLSVTILGHKKRSQPWISRNHLEPGDTLYLTAPIGLSSVGLFLQEKKIMHLQKDSFRKAHYSPHLPYSTVVSMHRMQMLPKTAIDLSDSLVETLELLSSNQYTLIINGDSLVHPEAIKFYKEKGLDPFKRVFTCGEDYQLLVAYRNPPPAELCLLHAGEVVSYQKKGFCIYWGGQDRTLSVKNYFRHF